MNGVRSLSCPQGIASYSSPFSRVRIKFFLCGSLSAASLAVARVLCEGGVFQRRLGGFSLAHELPIGKLWFPRLEAAVG